MAGSPDPAPDTTSLLVALWRARHVELDAPPHVFADSYALKLIAPPPEWRRQPAMDPARTKRVRASIVARARFVEDLLERQVAGGVEQYVILGSGCDTFALRRPDIMANLHLFEVDRPGHQTWKRHRLMQEGLGLHDRQRLVSVDFAAGDDWLEKVQEAGFDARKPAIVSAIGLSMYLDRAANRALLKTVAGMAAGSTLVMSFMVPADKDGPEERALREAGAQRARAEGTPLVSFYAPSQLIGMARQAGFNQIGHVSAERLTGLYFGGRSDGLRPLGTEELIVARR